MILFIIVDYYITIFLLLFLYYYFYITILLFLYYYITIFILLYYYFSVYSHAFIDDGWIHGVFWLINVLNKKFTI